MNSLDEQFGVLQTRLPDQCAKVIELKNDAFARFNALGFPTRKQEDWRYTDIKEIADQTYDLLPQAPDNAIEAQVSKLLETSALTQDEPRMVFIDGCYCERLSVPETESGISISSLANDWDSYASEQSGHNGDSDHPLAALNTAFVQDGALIAVTDGLRVNQPVHLVFAGSDRSGLAPQPRIIIRVGKNADVTVVQHFLDTEHAAGWVNLVTEISQAANSKLTLYRFQEHGTQTLHTTLLHAELAQNAQLSAGLLELGGRLVRNDLDIKLTEPGAEVDLFGVFLAESGQHMDNHIRVDHLAAYTTSKETFRGIIGDQGHGVFNGKVVVHRGAQHVDAKQNSDNLLLSDRAQIDTKPELEIYADDVKCSHGATVGELDEEQLFYLRARGIDAEAARGLLTFAFANSALDKIEIPRLRQRFAAGIAQRVAHHSTWETLP